MDIGTRNAARIVNVGSASGLYSLYSTAKVLMGRRAKGVAIALDFLKTGNCGARSCGKAATQLAKISNELERHSPSEAIWDIQNPASRAPWADNLASTVTSCADLYTTADGELMLPELLSLLRYAESNGQDVVALG